MKKLLVLLPLITLLLSGCDAPEPTSRTPIAKVVKAKLVDLSVYSGTSYSSYYLFAKDGTAISVYKATYALTSVGDTVSSDQWRPQ